MKNLQRYLQQVADARRRELLPYIYNHTQGRVQTGPFKGMLIVPNTMWGDGDTASKLLGLYENELHDFVNDAIASNPDTVINIGSAEGYYSVGMATCLPGSQVFAIDMDMRSMEVVNENVAANRLTNVSAINAVVDTLWLQEHCKDLVNPLLIFDCEGAELELLDPEKVPALTHASILVECHDCIISGITDTLTKRFQDTHTIKYTAQTVKDSYQFNFLSSLSDCDKWALVHEGRPSTMTWLYMVPKK
jgi:hypothetical protein